MSWYIENVEIGSETETVITVNGNSVTDTLTLSQKDSNITLTSKQIFDLYCLFEKYGITQNIVNF